MGEFWWWRVVCDCPVTTPLSGRWVLTCHGAWSVKARTEVEARRKGVAKMRDLVNLYHSGANAVADFAQIDPRVRHLARLHPVKEKR